MRQPYVKQNTETLREIEESLDDYLEDTTPGQKSRDYLSSLLDSLERVYKEMDNFDATEAIDIIAEMRAVRFLIVLGELPDDTYVLFVSLGFDQVV